MHIAIGSYAIIMYCNLNSGNIMLFNRITATGAYIVATGFLGLRSSLITLRFFVRLPRLIAKNVAKLFNLTSGIKVRVKASLSKM